MLVRVVPAHDGKHKYIGVFSNGVHTPFGAVGYEDFTIHKDKKRRLQYIKRHEKDLQTKDPYRAGYLSMYILWNKPTIEESIKDYNRMFF
jgi:hypothetical protein